MSRPVTARQRSRMAVTTWKASQPNETAKPSRVDTLVWLRRVIAICEKQGRPEEAAHLKLLLPEKDT